MADEEVGVTPGAGGSPGTVAVEPATFGDVEPARRAAKAVPANMDLVLDVQVPVSVVLGTVRKSIGEILALGEGQVVDLERGAGDPVDLLVNGKLVARGEVVIVDEHYGLRISEIVARDSGGA